MSDDADLVKQEVISEEMAPGGAPSTVPLTITSSGGSTTAAAPVKGQLESLESANAYRNDAAEATEEDLRAAESEESRVKASNADDLAIENLMNLAETRDAIDRNKREVQAAQALAESSHQEAETAAKAIQNYDYWAKQSTGHILMAKLAGALGGIGAAYLGQPNEVLADINRTIDRDFDAQKAFVTSKQHAAEMRRKGVADVQGQIEKELAALKVKQAISLEATAKKGEAMAIRAGIPVQEAKNNIVVLGLRARSAEQNADGLKNFEHHYTSQGSTTVAQHIVPGGAPAIARDENKVPIGTVPSARALPAFATRDADYKRAEDQLEALAKDIADHGERVVLPASIKRRQRLKENADIAVATVSPLGKTDEAMKKESASIGQSGTGGIKSFIVGANAEAVASKIEELKAQRQRYRNETLGPLPAAPVAAAPTTGGGRLSDQQIAQAQSWLAKNPRDPRAPARRANLKRLLDQQAGAR